MTQRDAPRRRHIPRHSDTRRRSQSWPVTRLPRGQSSLERWRYRRSRTGWARRQSSASASYEVSISWRFTFLHFLSAQRCICYRKMSGFKPSLLLTRLVINQLTSVIGACCRIGFVLIAGTTVAYCKDVEIDVGPSSPASSHRAATDISQAIDIVRSDIAAGNKPGTYRINLAYPAITLDRSIVLEGLRAPEGTRIILSGIPRTGTRISSGFRAERFLKTADPGGSPYKYTLALSDFPADTSKRLIDTFATSSPQKIIIRANNNLPLHPTRWPAQGFAQIQNIGTPLIGRLASLPFGLGASENKAIVPRALGRRILYRSLLFRTCPRGGGRFRRTSLGRASTHAR